MTISALGANGIAVKIKTKLDFSLGSEMPV